MIKYKSEDIKKSYEVEKHPILESLISWLGFLIDITITQGYEKRDYISVHSMIPLRGVDIRSRNFKNPQCIADFINEFWIYDPERPEKKCAIYHDVGRGAHLHLQACDNTQNL